LKKREEERNKREEERGEGRKGVQRRERDFERTGRECKPQPVLDRTRWDR